MPEQPGAVGAGGNANAREVMLQGKAAGSAASSTSFILTNCACFKAKLIAGARLNGGRRLRSRTRNVSGHDRNSTLSPRRLGTERKARVPYTKAAGAGRRSSAGNTGI
jgi:hypothetical protein